jgi:dTDP-4-dehydrorhamnose 3,5-epimerase-like enzyme
MRKANTADGAVINVPPVPWHEFANVGDTTMQVLIVEKKYEPAPVANQTVCPTRSQWTARR